MKYPREQVEYDDFLQLWREIAHLIVLRQYQGQGIGQRIMDRLKSKYEGFHQHVLVAERDAVGFYERCGFQRAGATEPMWIYDGADHISSGDATGKEGNAN